MADSPVLYVYYRPDNDDAYPGVPGRHITEADWARFSPSQRRTVEHATTQDGYSRRKVWVHRDLVDETEAERAEREAAEQAAREAYERGQSIVRYREFEKVVPGPGEVIVGTADGPVARDVSEIGGAPDAVRGVGVTRIIASTDPDYPLQNGELLILLEEPPTFFTDFTQTAPGDWTQPWVTTAGWAVVDDATGTGGKVFRANAAAAGRKAAAWMAIGPALNAEIVWRWRSGAGESPFMRAIFRGSGERTKETGYVIGHDSGTTAGVVFEYNNGASSVLTNTPSSFPAVSASTWHISRARIGPDEIAMRTWRDGTAEPTTWHLTYTGIQRIASAGFVGLLPFSNQTIDVDWVGVGFDGVAAPTGGV